MPYITIKAPKRYHQMSLDELLNAPPGYEVKAPVGNIGDTKTYFVEKIPDRLSDPSVISYCIAALSTFVDGHKDLYEADRNSLYKHFSVPKRSGGYRKIDAPLPPLMNALRELKTIFEENFYALHHTSAFAYVKKRSALDAVKRHQVNDSKWVFKSDCTNFFGSTSLSFTMDMLSKIWPFSEVVSTPSGKSLLEKALDLAFLDGGLPQGTPISPMITNLIMIPIDHELMNGLRSFDGKHLVYTRYADDMDISSRVEFDWKKLMNYIESVFKKYNAPYSLKLEKTHYGSRAGRNWMLGVMYNKDGNITLGHKRKEAFRASLNDYSKRRGTDNPWAYGDIQSLNGQYAYFKKVEPAYTAGCLEHYSKKFGFNILSAIRDDLKNR